MKYQMPFLFFFLITLVNCETISSKRELSNTDKIQFSTGHIDFSRGNQNEDCCTAQGKKIAIASGGSASSKCGLEVYKNGGNLVDAAAAVAFCLAVERPHSAGLGGGAFLTLSLRGQKPIFVDFRETAPRRATRDMYLDKEGNVIPNLSLNGGLSIATPGFVAGWYEVHKKWGKVSWKSVLKPAILLARDGFTVYPFLATAITKRQDVLTNAPYLTKLKVGDRCVQEDLAKTLELISEKGKNGFYQGPLAKEIAQAAKSSGGILEERDLNHYKVVYREPLRGSFQGYDFVTAPPPSAGGVIMLETFNLLSGYSLKPEMAYSDYVHLFTESLKRGFADRANYIGDPAFFKDKTYLKLITSEYANRLRKSINPEKAIPSDAIAPARYLKVEHPETCHLSLIDSEGNAISSTMTINFYFGSGVVVPGRGIVLNDEMDDFSAKSGVKNTYGLVSNESNEISPGKRPVSSMMPTLIFRNGKPVAALGAPGGAQIISGVTGTLLNWTLIFKGDIRKAVFAPRIHHQWVPDKTILEKPAFSKETLNRLEQMGHQIDVSPWTSLVSAVAWDETSQTFIAVNDPRDVGGSVAE